MNNPSDVSFSSSSLVSLWFWIVCCSCLQSIERRGLLLQPARSMTPPANDAISSAKLPYRSLSNHSSVHPSSRRTFTYDVCYIFGILDPLPPPSQYQIHATSLPLPNPLPPPQGRRHMYMPPYCIIPEEGECRRISLLRNFAFSRWIRITTCTALRQGHHPRAAMHATPRRPLHDR